MEVKGIAFRSTPFIISALWHTCADNYTRERACDTLLYDAEAYARAYGELGS